MDLKKEAARAAYGLIRDQTEIGLGAGTTIGWLVGFLQEGMMNGRQITLYSSSDATKILLEQAGLAVREISQTNHIDQYFDSCDQLDQQLNALKSGAGIHTTEKLLASMATAFIVLVDEAKFVTRFDSRIPLVLELLPEALAYVSRKMAESFPGVILSIRKSGNSNTNLITRYGNYLLDCFLPVWPEPETVESACRKISGIVETSLFFQIASEALVAGTHGITRYQKKGDIVSRLCA